jgi:hypothetical protein
VFLRKSADGLVVGLKHRFDRRAPRRACHGGERVSCASLAALERQRLTHAPTSNRPAVERGTRRPHFGDTQATAGAHQAPPADVVPPTTTQLSRQRRRARARPRRCSNAAAQLDHALALVPPFASPPHSSRPGARTRFCRRRAKSDDDVLPVHETVGNALLHCNTMRPTNSPCRPRIGTSSNKTTADRRNQETGRHATAHSRQATLGNSSTQTDTRCLGSAHAGTTPHTRRARPIWRRANDQRTSGAGQRRRGTPSAAVVVVVGRRRRAHMHSVCQQRSSASLGLALSPTSVQRVRHVVLSLATSHQRVERVNARAHSA